MRAFISLKTGELFGPSPAGAADGEWARIEDLEAALKGAGGALRFVKDEARHITLRFFGELDPARRGDVEAAVAEVAKAQVRFPVATRGVGFFPNANRPKVVWVGLEDVEHQVQPLHAALHAALKAAGLDGPAETFVPHITVARVTQAPPGPALADAVDPFVAARFGSTEAKGLEFIESTLKQGGPVYRTLSDAGFGKKRA